jgi:hypothetical protein
MADRRTKELRKAAALFDWKTDPFIPPPPRLPGGMREPLRYDCGHAKPRHVELRGSYHSCPGCEHQDRRNRRHWLLLAVAIGLLLTVTCAARAASDGPCAPYSPIDGRTCAPPARLGHIGQAPVCYCPGPRVAGR